MLQTCHQLLFKITNAKKEEAWALDSHVSHNIPRSLWSILNLVSTIQMVGLSRALYCAIPPFGLALGSLPKFLRRYNQTSVQFWLLLTS